MSQIKSPHPEYGNEHRTYNAVNVERGLRIRQRREELGLTQKDVANRMGYTQGMIARWERGEVENMKRATMGTLANVLQTTPSYLMGWDNSAEILDTTTFRKIPILGRISAGNPLTAAEEIIGYDQVSDATLGYILVVNGDSMIGAGIHHGYQVYVSQDADVENGDIVVALINGDDATIKRFYQYGDVIILRPDNPTMKEHQYRVDEVTILGKVRAVRFKL